MQWELEHNYLVLNNWHGFLRLGGNAIEIFRYLSTEIISKWWNSGDLVSAFNDLCISTKILLAWLHVTTMKPIFVSFCTLHVLKTHSKVIACTVDTDVLALAISVFAKLKSHTEEFWVDFGAVKKRKFYPVRRIFNELENQKF